MNYTYIVRCKDDTLYCGWTNNLDKRMASHNTGTGAKYTRSRYPVELVYYEIFATKEEAMRRECAIKKLSRKEKLKLITEHQGRLFMENIQALFMDFEEPLSDRLFHEERMYTYIKNYAMLKGMDQTIDVLPYARKLHEGQTRKGKEQVPYIYHPLLVACHALALGLDDDDLVSAALLHDVCEDCGVLAENLPVNETTKQAVALLTKSENKTTKQYYADISENWIATMIKFLDRCNNISGMATGFSQKKMVDYINETEKYIIPLLREAKHKYPKNSNQIFLIKYHMISVITTLKHQIIEG